MNGPSPAPQYFRVKFTPGQWKKVLASAEIAGLLPAQFVQRAVKYANRRVRLPWWKRLWTWMNPPAIEAPKEPSFPPKKLTGDSLKCYAKFLFKCHQRRNRGVALNMAFELWASVTGDVPVKLISPPVLEEFESRLTASGSDQYYINRTVWIIRDIIIAADEAGLPVHPDAKAIATSTGMLADMADIPAEARLKYSGPLAD